MDLLHRKGVEIIIGVYASKRAYNSSFSEGNLYQASVEFLRHLAFKYQTKAEKNVKNIKILMLLPRPQNYWKVLMIILKSA